MHVASLGHHGLAQGLEVQIGQQVEDVLQVVQHLVVLREVAIKHALQIRLRVGVATARHTQRINIEKKEG